MFSTYSQKKKSIYVCEEREGHRERESKRGRESTREGDSKCKLYQNKKSHTKRGKENPKQCLMYWNAIGHLYGYKNKNQYLNSEFPFLHKTLLPRFN